MSNDHQMKYCSIRYFIPGTIQGIIKKSYEAFFDYFPEERERFYSQWEQEDHAAFTQKETIGKCVAFSCPLGLPVGYFSWDPRQFPVGIIGQNCVLPEHRGQGYGSRQIEWIIKHFRENNFTEIKVTTGDHGFFLPALRMYKKCGFKETRRMNDRLFDLIELSIKLE